MKVISKKTWSVFYYLFNKQFKKLTSSFNLAIIFAIMSFISVMATYFAISQSDSPFGPNPSNVLGYIVVDLILLLGLTAIICKRVVTLIIQRRKGSVGSRMQAKIVRMFSLVAIVPSIFMAIFSLVFFSYGIQSWFDKKVNIAIDESVEIARLYLEEHKKIITADILGVARDLNRDAYNMRKDPSLFSKKLSILAGVRKLPEALVFQKNETRDVMLARTNLSFSLKMILEDLPQDTFNRAREGELVILAHEKDDRVIALIRLENYFDTYLLVGRFVDTKIINHIELTEGAANEYTKLKSDMSSLQVKFFIVFIIVSLLLLLAVVWFGFIFAVALVDPVRELVVATERVKNGDLSARVKEGHENDEVATLARAFNSMAQKLEAQRTELISAQRRSAWSDVARRIAHEIKNPLTPIQLATDRLKRKYKKEMEGKDEFYKYIDTISRNISSIGNMVEEFVNFARTPAPIFGDNDICILVKDVIFSREEANEKIKIDYDIPDSKIVLNCDAGQIARVMTNLLKNAEESIEENLEDNDYLGHIKVDIYEEENNCFIKIVDNGSGFTESMLERITEPYVTTKSKGTGLGLAIVKKIIEDHAGEIKFFNIEGGACVSIGFPIER